jgi:hypothetical protein
VGLYYLGFPAFLQPVHLLLASILPGLQFLAFSIWRHASRATSTRPVAAAARAATR